MFSPQEIDRKSLALHQLVADKLRHDPSLFRKVQENLDSLQRSSAISTLAYYVDWQQAVDQGMDFALALAVEESERGQSMRQASPFAGILTEPERLAFLKSWSDRHEAA